MQCPQRKSTDDVSVSAPQEFKCEICGEASYWGRRAFERHFKEWRHQNGMRALGIPNNKLFYEVTKIADAEELWRNVQVGSTRRLAVGTARVSWRNSSPACTCYNSVLP